MPANAERLSIICFPFFPAMRDILCGKNYFPPGSCTRAMPLLIHGMSFLKIPDLVSVFRHNVTRGRACLPYGFRERSTGEAGGVVESIEIMMLRTSIVRTEKRKSLFAQSRS